jgi:hypothetical protein
LALYFSHSDSYFELKELVEMGKKASKDICPRPRYCSGTASSMENAPLFFVRVVHGGQAHTFVGLL